MVAVNNIIRASTRGQTTEFQKKYHAGKKTINLIGSAYKPDNNPVFKFIKSKLRKDGTVIVNLATADRFSRNTQECKDLKKFIKQKNKNLIVIANRERFDFVKDFDKFLELIKDPEAQSRAISEKSKKIWEERKKNPQPIRDIILTEVETYFVRHIISTRGDEGDLIPVSILYENLKSCGIVEFSEKNIRKWRRDLDPIEEDDVHSLKCAETNLRFAHPPNIDYDPTGPPLWKKYNRFVLFPDFAINLAKNYPYLNAVWEPEIGLDSMQDIDHALDEVIEDEVIEDAAPAPDILAKIKEAHDMLKEGVLTEQEFIAFKAKLI